MMVVLFIALPPSQSCAVLYYSKREMHAAAFHFKALTHRLITYSNIVYSYITLVPHNGILLPTSSV